MAFKEFIVLLLYTTLPVNQFLCNKEEELNSTHLYYPLSLTKFLHKQLLTVFCIWFSSNSIAVSKKIKHDCFLRNKKIK